MDSERISITGVLNESLASKYFYDESESPTLGHLHALLKVAHGQAIPKDVERANLDAAIRHRGTLRKAINVWNDQVMSGLGEQTTTKFLAFTILLDTIALSYGSILVNPQDRKALILKAVDMTEKKIDPSHN